MVSDFRRKKLLDLFSYYDLDKTGNMEKKAFEVEVKEIAKARKYAEGDVKYKQIEETLLKIWDGIQKTADSDGDGKVSDEEWISIWDKYAKNPSNPLEWQTIYIKLIFSLWDVSNDGKVDKNEYVSVNESFGVNKDTAASTFDQISKGKPSITWADFQNLWLEYVSSEDPDAPGNFLFCTPDA